MIPFTHCWGDKKAGCLFQSIKVNVIARLELEITYFEAISLAIQPLSDRNTHTVEKTVLGVKH